MLSTPERYNSDLDKSLQEAGYVYIEDLALGGVILALKRGASVFSPMESMGFGQLLRMNDTTDVDKLNTGLAEGLESIDKWYIRKGKRIELPEYPGIAVVKDYRKRIGVITEQLDFCDVKTGFVAGPKMDTEDLTGFLAFDPSAYDYAHESKGLAQVIVRSHREDPTLFTSQFTDSYHFNANHPSLAPEA